MYILYRDTKKECYYSASACRCKAEQPLASKNMSLSTCTLYKHNYLCTLLEHYNSASHGIHVHTQADILYNIIVWHVLLATVTWQHKPADLLTDIGESASQHAVGTGLASKRLSNYHKAVANNHHLINLQDLPLKHFSALQVHLLAVLLDGGREDGIVRLW